MSSTLWTIAAVVLGGYILWEITNTNTPGIHDAGSSSVVFEPSRDIENRDMAEEVGDVAEGIPNEDVGYDQDERARRVLEERQSHQVGVPNRVNAWKQKAVVGTKKARSLAKRDQRRAYFEYVRHEAEREREKVALEEEIFGDLIAEEREERRARIEEGKQSLEEKNRNRRAHEEKERQHRNERRLEIEKMLNEHGRVKLYSDEDIDIANDISSAVVIESGIFVLAINRNLIHEMAKELREGEVSAQMQLETLLRIYK